MSVLPYDIYIIIILFMESAKDVHYLVSTNHKMYKLLNEPIIKKHIYPQIRKLWKWEINGFWNGMPKYLYDSKYHTKHTPYFYHTNLKYCECFIDNPNRHIDNPQCNFRMNDYDVITKIVIIDESKSNTLFDFIISGTIIFKNVSIKELNNYLDAINGFTTIGAFWISFKLKSDRPVNIRIYGYFVENYIICSNEISLVFKYKNITYKYNKNILEKISFL